MTYIIFFLECNYSIWRLWNCNNCCHKGFDVLIKELLRQRIMNLGSTECNYYVLFARFVKWPWLPPPTQLQLQLLNTMIVNRVAICIKKGYRRNNCQVEQTLKCTTSVKQHREGKKGVADEIHKETRPFRKPFCEWWVLRLLKMDGTVHMSVQSIRNLNLTPNGVKPYGILRLHFLCGSS